METVIEAHRSDARYSLEIKRTEVMVEACPNNALLRFCSQIYGALIKFKDFESPKPKNFGLPRLYGALNLRLK